MPGVTMDFCHSVPMNTWRGNGKVTKGTNLQKPCMGVVSEGMFKVHGPYLPGVSLLLPLRSEPQFRFR